MNMTLIFNRTSYLKLKANKLLITKNNLLFIPTYKSLVNLNQITRLSLIDSKAFDINNSDRHPEFEAVVAVEAITGTLFYKPDYILIIDLLEKNRMEFEINSDSKSLFDIISFLQNRLTQNH